MRKLAGVELEPERLRQASLGSNESNTDSTLTTQTPQDIAPVDIEAPAVEAVEPEPESEDSMQEKQDVPAAPGVTSGRAKWLLGVVGLVLACGATMVDLAVQGLVSRRDGAVVMAALTATQASLGFTLGLFNFIFNGSISLIGSAVGEGDDMKAGRYARLSMISAVVTGLTGTIFLVSCSDLILGLFGQEAVAAEARGVFRLQASAFTLAVFGLSMTGIMLGLMYVHVVVLFVIIGSCVTLATFYSLYLMTDLGLKAFAFAGTLGAMMSSGLAITYLMQGERRARFGLGLGMQGIGLAELRDLSSCIGCLAFRSIIAETPYLLSVMWCIRLSPVHGAVYQFLTAQSQLSDRIAMGFAMGMNFIGSRLWGGKFHSAFWNVLIVFLLYVCTPLAIILSSVEMARGQGSLAKAFAKQAEQAYFDAVMTNSAFVLYVLLIVGKAYLKMIEMGMIAMQEFGRLALVQAVSFAAFLCVAVTGYFCQDFSMILLGAVVFIFTRILGGSFFLLRKVRTYPFEWYKRGTNCDPEYALKLTINDPAVAKVFGGRAEPKLEEQTSKDEFANV